ncbi:GOLPH3/VPS74 family protein [Rhizohabitans arisaemae]|uniref:GOLPH3/VPS74 family protein n=1 Tax=Rhizohabitans arisaemae TaxID=2720610 RepID=UPI0024B0BCBA|nr:GPP34 family phosphoprotein [Rhizohabitans arisaemae]
MRLADEFFLISWDTAHQGRPRLNPGTVALGLGGALLAELMLQDRITVRGSELRILSSQPVEDPLTGDLLAQIRDAPQHTGVRTWLAYLAGDAVENVAERMRESDLIHREQSRSLWRIRVRYLAVDFIVCSWPAARLALTLTKREPIGLSGMVLAGLMEATGLFESVVSNPADRPASRQYLDVLLASLPPPYVDLIGQLKAAVGDAVLAYRG